MAKGRTQYAPEIVDPIYASLRTDGCDKLAYEAGGISKDTFYVWQHRYPEFADGVKEAKRFYRENLPKEQREQALKAFSDYLFGRVVETWESTETEVDSDGRVKEKRSCKKISRGVPKWAIDRILGPSNLDTLDALLILMTNGMANQSQVDVVSEGIEGIRERLRSLSHTEDGDAQG